MTLEGLELTNTCLLQAYAIHWLHTSMIAVYMFFSMLHHVAWAKAMAAWSNSISTLAMPNPPVIFASMQRSAGERRLWLQLTKHGMSKLLARLWQRWNQLIHPLRQLLNKLQRAGLLTVTASTPQPRLGELPTLYPSHQTLTTLPSTEIICWITESKWPFQIVNDCGFQLLMKTGQPGYHIPSAETISCDVKGVYVQVQQCIASGKNLTCFDCLWCLWLSLGAFDSI